MINTIGFTERLQKVITFYEETASSFAEKIGVQRSSISHILSGRNKPSLDFVMKVLHSYPEVDLYWLMNGKGKFPKADEIKKDDTQPQLKFSESNSEPLTQFPNSKNSSDLTEIDKIIIFYKDGSFKSYQN
ncbi:helix-turn-helix domain-containing protein [Winogradskyella sp.]|jgi:transcriptional regulator with XRE-family HTH domain|nr:helix-turn-helix domain-containing protein [Winogradskyella sp.]MDG1661671.1 helix-turn-helix transcriptional regulator [Winogradskyella sp.]